MPSFCRLQYEKWGEGLEGFITWCMLLLTSHTVASHDQSSSNRTRRTNWTERKNWIQGKKSEGERATQMWADWMWCQQRHASHEKSVQAFPRFLYCKRQKLGVKAWEWGYWQPSEHLWGNHVLAIRAWKFLTATLKCICNDPLTDVLKVFSVLWG